MKIRLLNDGGYGGMENVDFPVEVEGVPDASGFDVKSSELYRIGANEGEFGFTLYFSLTQGECEVVNNG